MNTTKILALRKPLLISAWLLAMQGATYAQNPIVQTQLTTDGTSGCRRPSLCIYRS